MELVDDEARGAHASRAVWLDGCVIMDMVWKDPSLSRIAVRVMHGPQTDVDHPEPNDQAYGDVSFPRFGVATSHDAWVSRG